MLDRVVRIDNEGVAVRNTIWRTNAEAIDQRTIGVGKRPDRQLVEILVIATPCELHELIVGRTAQDDCVTVFEIRCKTRKFGNLGRANKGEILRVEEDNLPLVRKACFGDFFKCRNAVFFVMVETGLYAGDLEGGKLIADTEHFIPACKFNCYAEISELTEFSDYESYIGILVKSVKAIITIKSIDFNDGAKSKEAMLNISVRQLHYFMALVKAGSFSRAAEVVGVTQSTLSAAIQALETELGVTLIDRSGRRMQLLPAGEDFLARARTIIALIEELPEHARQAERPLTTRLRMGVIPSIAPFLLPKVLPATAKAFPELQLTIREGLTRSLLDSLRSGSLDVALVAHPYDLDEFEIAELGRDIFYLAVRRDHALANREQVDADDLQDQPFLLLETGHCLREHVMAAIGSTPAQASGDVHATSIMTLVQLVDFGMGVTLLPEVAVKAGATRGTELSIVPYEGKHNYRSLVLVWRSNAARRNEFQLFADHLRGKCMKPA